MPDDTAWENRPPEAGRSQAWSYLQEWHRQGRRFAGPEGL